MIKAYRYEYTGPDQISREGPFVSMVTDLNNILDSRIRSRHRDPLSDNKLLEAMCEHLGYDREPRVEFRASERTEAFYKVVNSDRWFFAFPSMHDCLKWFPPACFAPLTRDDFSLFEYDAEDHDIIIGTDQCVIHAGVIPTRTIMSVDDCFAILEKELMA